MVAGSRVEDPAYQPSPVDPPREGGSIRGAPDALDSGTEVTAAGLRHRAKSGAGADPGFCKGGVSVININVKCI